MKTEKQLNDFTKAYVHCALWSSTDDHGDPLDKAKSQEDIALETLARMVADCAKFQEENGEDLKAFTPDDAQNGHDFWLTRCGHGAGFWDRYPDSHPCYEIGERLSESARAFGTCDLYIGDDGRVYL